MEHLYAQFENNVWLDLTKVVAACPGDFLYGKTFFVPSDVTFLLGAIGRVSSVMVYRDDSQGVYGALVVAGGVTCRARQVVVDRDGALERLICGE